MENQAARKKRVKTNHNGQFQGTPLSEGYRKPKVTSQRPKDGDSDTDKKPNHKKIIISMIVDLTKDIAETREMQKVQHDELLDFQREAEIKRTETSLALSREAIAAARVRSQEAIAAQDKSMQFLGNILLQAMNSGK